MTRAVNLLPWRARQAQRRHLQNGVLLGSSVTIALVVVMGLWWHGMQGQRQQQLAQAMISQTLDALQQQLSLQQTLLKQRDALLQARFLRQLRLKQHQYWQDFWRRLPVLMPANLWLSRVERRQRVVMFEGLTSSVLAVRDFRQQLVSQPLFVRVMTGHVQRQPGGDYRFSLRAHLREAADE